MNDATYDCEGLAAKRRINELAEGYEAIAEEQKHIAVLAAQIEYEVIPEWE